MTEEDHTVARLQGYTVLVKFKDGEELLIKADIGKTLGDIADFFEDVERILNTPCKNDNQFEAFPFANYSFSRDSIKYFRKI